MNTTTHINAGGSWDRALDDRVHLGRSQVADERVTLLMKVAHSNATTDNSLPPNGCERRSQTQMASKRV